jgi:hypothetical protein
MPDTLSTRLGAIAAQDVREVTRKDAEYGSSWKERGGAGAFFVWVRKYDRMVIQLKKFHYDVFEAVKADQRKDGLIDDIRDCRRYLLLWEDELQQLGYLPGHVAKESGLQALVAEVQAVPEAGPGYLRDEVRAFAVMLEQHLRTLPVEDDKSPLYLASNVCVEADHLFVMEKARTRGDINTRIGGAPAPGQLEYQVMTIAERLLRYVVRLSLLPRRSVVERALDYHLLTSAGGDDDATGG